MNPIIHRESQVDNFEEVNYLLSFGYGDTIQVTRLGDQCLTHKPSGTTFFKARYHTAFPQTLYVAQGCLDLH